MKLKLMMGLLAIFFIQAGYAQEIKFISFSDIHFNPFASCKNISFKRCPIVVKLKNASAKDWKEIFNNNDTNMVASIGHDTNYALLESSLKAISLLSKKENPQFALILGDFLAHNFRPQYILFSHDKTLEGYTQFVAKTLEFLTLEIKAALPNIEIIPVVGNNDSYTGNYRVVPSGKFFQDTMYTWKNFFKNEKNKIQFQDSFPKAGYYAVDVGAHKILVLNTVLFSRFAKETERSAANEEFVWLNKQLGLAAKKNQKVILAFHIPVGVDIHSSLKIFFSKVKEFWRPEFKDKFREILENYTQTVTAIMPGHVHRDIIHVLGFTMPGNIPVSFTPSISPIFGNNPSFKIYRLDLDDFKLGGYEEYDAPLNEDDKIEWQKEYSMQSSPYFVVR